MANEIGKIVHFLRRRSREYAESIFDIKIYSSRPHGREDWFDIKRTNWPIETIFDVGANVGQSAVKFRSAFPSATVHCFEPVSSLFGELQSKLSELDDVHCHPVALGSKAGQFTIYLTPHPSTNSLIEPEDFVGTETVEVTTVDAFTSERKIERIDLLKVDTEGFDLEVLHGAEKMLSTGKVLFVLVEVGFHPGDTRHIVFDTIRDFLMRQNFSVFGIYDQNLEWSGENRLRFANACFSHASVVGGQ